MTVAPVSPSGVRVVAETDDGSGLHLHPAWADAFPWLVQGVTGSDADMSLFGSAPTGEVVPRWQRLRDRLGCRTMVHARQVHRASILLHRSLPPGLLIGPDADGHITREPGTLLAVSVADCVPVLIAAPAARTVALLHGGWRGVAAGILERGITMLTSSFPLEAADLHVHFGPAICGECFEVGPEVPEGLGMPVPDDVTHVDLRAVLAHRAAAVGVEPAHISISAFCTRHGESPFYSHRGGCAERQIAVLAIRAV
ncbi:MAG TPA: polyphenol oxidase family protein [Longimicrobiales bacterium]|nr:polyphenol oxidase family protein [Longimicrobiales bacterium]